MTTDQPISVHVLYTCKNGGEKFVEHKNETKDDIPQKKGL
jgi:hypothetical protein